MFQKLKYKFDSQNLNLLDSHMKFGEEVDGKFRGIEYFNIGLTNTKQYWSVIPKEYHNKFALLLMKINRSIPAHTDSGIKCTINFYMNTENCITTFYSLNDENEKYQIKNQTDGYIFDETNLTEVGSFKAANGEVWILDVTIPHSVYPETETPMERTAVTLATNDYTYDEVCEMLRETGWL